MLILFNQKVPYCYSILTLCMHIRSKSKVKIETEYVHHLGFDDLVVDIVVVFVAGDVTEMCSVEKQPLA